MPSLRRFVRMPDFNNVVAGQRATLPMPVGARKYHKLVIQYKAGADNQATIEAALKNSRFLINGRPQREATVAQINVMRAYRGRAFQTGIVTIEFSDQGARAWQGEELLGWGTFNLSTLTFEVDIDAAAVAPALVAYAEIEDSNEPLGAIMKWRRHYLDTSAAATKAIRDLPVDPREAYSRFHIFTGNATAVQLKADNDIIVETVSRAVLAAHYTGRPQQTVMQANVLTLDLAASTQVDSFLPMLRSDGRKIQDFPLEVTVNAATNAEIIAEVVGPAL